MVEMRNSCQNYIKVDGERSNVAHLRPPISCFFLVCNDLYGKVAWWSKNHQVVLVVEMLKNAYICFVFG